MSKPVVSIRPLNTPTVGCSLLGVTAADRAGSYTRTSKIIRVEGNEVETQNTIYRLKSK